MKSGILFSAVSSPALGLSILTHNLQGEGGREKGECWLVHPGRTPRPTQASNFFQAVSPTRAAVGPRPLVGWAWQPMLCSPRADRRKREASLVSGTHALPLPLPSHAAGGKGAWPSARAPQPPAPPPESPPGSCNRLPAAQAARKPLCFGVLAALPRLPEE